VMLADVYENGIGVPRDPEEARRNLARVHSRKFALEQTNTRSI
jgi:TPR repeat protein